jgi:hypothetical protein
MTPYQTALARYGQPDPGQASFHDMAAYCLTKGVLISLPDVFLMAVAIHSADPPQMVEDTAFISRLQSQPAPDTWHILIAAGRMDAIRRIAATSRLPFVSYFRGGKYRVLPIAAFLRHDQAETPAHRHPAAAGILHRPREGNGRA